MYAEPISVTEWSRYRKDGIKRTTIFAKSTEIGQFPFRLIVCMDNTDISPWMEQTIWRQFNIRDTRWRSLQFLGRSTRKVSVHCIFHNFWQIYPMKWNGMWRIRNRKFSRNWQHEYKMKQKPSLVKVILKTFWCEIAVLGAFCFVTDVAVKLTMPFLLDNLLSYFR